MTKTEFGSTRKKQGMGVPSVLTVVFIILRLTGEVDWAWVWVLAPLWISLALMAATSAMLGIALAAKSSGLADK